MQKLCCVCTRQQFSASLVYLVTSLPPYLNQFSTFFGGNCIMAPQPPPRVVPAPPVPAFALGPGCSHAILNFDDPNTGATTTKLYNKAITLLETKFDGEADNLAVFLASVRNRACRSIGNGLSPCQSMMEQQETSSLTTDRFPSTTREHTQ